MGTAWGDDDERGQVLPLPCLGFSRALGTAPDALEEARRFAGRCSPFSSETASGVCRFVEQPLSRNPMTTQTAVKKNRELFPGVSLTSPSNNEMTQFALPHNHPSQRDCPGAGILTGFPFGGRGDDKNSKVIALLYERNYPIP